MDGVSVQAANAAIDAVLRGPDVTPPLMLRLLVGMGTDTTPGYQVIGGGYEPQPVVMESAFGAMAANVEPVNFYNMPTETVLGIEIWDSSTPPRRRVWAQVHPWLQVLTGDSILFPPGAVVVRAG